MNSGIDPAANAAAIAHAATKAAQSGAVMMFTPEMSGLLDRDRDRAHGNIRTEADDDVLAAARTSAAKHGIWIALGSLALTDPRGGDLLVNRSFVIDAAGAITARYDKLHLFDVDLPGGESWRESSTYRTGDAAVVTDTPLGTMGLSICYDLRFPALYAALTAHGATILSVPSAFTVPTGKAHWHVLLRARAIEASTFVVAAAQTGQHEDGRKTFGHSLVVDPWGVVLLDMGEAPGLGFCDIDSSAVAELRARIPAINHRRTITVE